MNSENTPMIRFERPKNAGFLFRPPFQRGPQQGAGPVLNSTKHCTWLMPANLGKAKLYIKPLKPFKRKSRGVLEGHGMLCGRERKSYYRE